MDHEYDALGIKPRRSAWVSGDGILAIPNGFLSGQFAGLRYWSTLFILAAAYAAAARLSLLMALPPGHATAVWPPAGIALAALMVLGIRHWPGIWLGATLVNWLVPGTSLPVAAFIGIGNCVAAIAAALLVHRFAQGTRLLHQPGTTWRYVAIALAASAIAATTGIGTLFAGGRIPPEELWTQWITWSLGDATGIVVVTPLILSWGGHAATPPARASRGEYLAFIAVLLTALWMVHGPWHDYVMARTPLYLMFPILAWAAMRLDQRAVTTAGFLIAAYSVFALRESAPELSPGERNGALLFMQLYVSMVVLAGLLLSALAHQLSSANRALSATADSLEQRVGERTRALNDTTAELRALNARVTELQDEERRRLAAQLHDIIGQTLGALSAELALLRHGLRDSGDDEVVAQIERANVFAKQVMRAMRQVQTELHPLGIEVAGWPAILRWYGDAMQSRTGATVTIRADATLPHPAAKIADILVRIYLEALNNAEKHAGARKIHVTLRAHSDRIVLSVRDDGGGFDSARVRPRGPQSGWGMMIMRERACAVGADLRVRSNPGKGTRVEFSVPSKVWV